MTYEENCDPHEAEMGVNPNWRDDLPHLSYVADVFRALGDENRLSILYLVTQKELCVHELALALGTSSSNISHHLRLLRTLRLIKSKRDGKKVCYLLDDDHVKALLEMAFIHADHQ
jgi:DNA-binding transcriptional ArsR family regulator